MPEFAPTAAVIHHATGVRFLPARKTNLAEVVRMLGSFEVPCERRVERSDPIERVFQILTDRRVNHNAPHELSVAYRESLKGAIASFVKRGEPIPLVLAWFHTKIPNILETSATLPDLGEIASIHFLQQINQNVRRHYEPGIRYNIIAEGYVFGRELDGLTDATIREFYTALGKYIEKIGAADIIRLIPLRQITEVESFESAFRESQLIVADALATDPPDGDKLADSSDVTLSSVSVRTAYQRQLIMMLRTVNLCRLGLLQETRYETFTNILDDVAIAQALSTRYAHAIRARAAQMTQWYVSFHLARDRIIDDFYHKVGIEKGIRGSFAHKPNQLSLKATGSNHTWFPHHGVPVFLPSGKRFRPPMITPLARLEELASCVNRQEIAFEPVYIDESKEPFFLMANPR